MSSVEEGTTPTAGPSKRRLSSGSYPPTKRVQMEAKEESSDKKEAEGVITDEEEKMVTEADVGISAYVNDSLIPISGGIIKHRCVI